MTLDPQNLLNISQAADILKVTRQTVYSMIRRGELHPVTIADRSYLAKDEVENVSRAIEQLKSEPGK